MPGMRVPLPALAALLFTACASPLRRYEGVYHRAFEQHSLRPCTTSSPDRAWWIVMSPAADSVAAAAVARDPSAVLHARQRTRCLRTPRRLRAHLQRGARRGDPAAARGRLRAVAPLITACSASMCPSTFTFSNTARTVPVGSITTVVRCTPMYLRP